MPVPKRHINSKQRLLLIQGFDQLATLIGCGLSLHNALQVVHAQIQEPTVKRCFYSFISTVNEGLPLVHAAEQLPMKLPMALVGYLRLAEQSGQFSLVIENMVIEFNNAEQQRQQIVTAIRYPAAILLMSIVITAMLLIFVLPKFTALFSVDALPALTRSLLNLSTFLQQHGAMLLLLTGGIALLLAVLRHFFLHRWQQLLLCLPLIGPLLSQARIQQLFQRLALLLSSGMTAIEALQLCGDSSPWQLTKSNCQYLSRAIADGQSWSTALTQIQLQTPLIMAYVSTGEQTGRIDDMLSRLATQLNQQLNQQYRQRIGLIQPLLMLLLGGIIGTLLLAMYLPIFTLGQQF